MICPFELARREKFNWLREWVVIWLIAAMTFGGSLPAVDYDGDGIDDDPYQWDSDGDFYSDGMEADENTDPYDTGDYPSSFSPDLDDGTYYQDDPTMMDSDGDGYTDDDENNQGTDPYNPADYPGSDPMGMDSDGDGYSDDDETSQGTDPNDPSDYPGSYDPTTTDSDGDGYTDDDETGQGTDPNDPSDFPGSYDPTTTDSDGDGYTDEEETNQGTDPYDPAKYPGSDPTAVDTDGDGLSDDEESTIGTNPNLSDSDGDGLSDSTEHNGYSVAYDYFDEATQTTMSGTYGPLTTDPNNADHDGDLLYDGWEAANNADPTDPANGLADDDGDGLSNGEEVSIHLTDFAGKDTDEDGEWDGYEVTQGTDPLDQLSRTSLDTDGDVMSDDWETLHGLAPSDSTDAGLDLDGDTLTNFQECLFGSDPQQLHSDSDGYDDGLEWTVGTDLIDPADGTQDRDGDGAPDLWEALYGFDYSVSDFHDTDDTDGDGLYNLEEYNEGYNPTQPDTDGDGISDYDDFWGTGPQDSDGDGLTDDDEINLHGTDPNDVDSDDDELTDYAEINGIQVIVTSGTNTSIITHTTNPLDADTDGDELDDKFEIENFFDPNDLADGSSDDDNDNLTTAEEINLHGTDWADYDSDNDREKDGYEVTQGTDPLDATSRTEADTDGDLMSDAWETSQGLDPTDASDANTDLDEDGLTNLEDFQLWAFANNPDSDEDGYEDGFEVDNGKDPADPDDATDDRDGDGMPDLWEITYLLDPNADDADGHVEGDGLNNLEEYLAGTDPNDEDSDDDGRNDGDEVNVAVPAAGQTMAEAEAADRYTDPSDSDTDNDGFPDGYEIVEELDPLNSADGYSDFDGDTIASGDEFEIYQTDWRRKDTDGDGEWDNEEIIAEPDPSDILSRSSVDSDGDHMSDDWETTHGLDAALDDGGGDEDNDGLENYREYVWRTDPHVPDHDDDGYEDGFERDHGFDPSDASDGTFDSDGDGMPDLWEITHQFDHNYPGDAGNDEEPDLLTNLEEFLLGTDPQSSDSDNDGEPDRYEVNHGTDPTDPASKTNLDTNTTVTSNPDGSFTTTIEYGGGASTATTVGANGDVTTVNNHGDGTADTHIDHGNGETTDIVEYDDGSSRSVTYHGNGVITKVAVSSGGATTTTTITDHGDGTSTAVAVESNGVTTTTENHGDGTRTVTTVQADNTSTTVTETFDADLDQMDDAWETANGLNPQDASDASRDFDYDRLSNLDEFKAGSEPNTDWTFVEIDALGDGNIASLNDVGEFVGLDGLALERWEGTQWVNRGTFSAGLQGNFLLQNNFGLVAVWKQPPSTGPNGTEARVFDIPSGTESTISPPGASFVEVLRVTDSGFVYGRYKNTAGDRCLFRHRDGETEFFENPQGGDLDFRAGNRRGEILASFDGAVDVQLYAGGKWYPALANPNTMVVTDAGDLIDVAAASLATFRWMSNANGDLLNGLHPYLDFYNHAFGAGFTAPGFSETVIEDENPEDTDEYSRPVVPLSMNELGDVVGKIAYLNTADVVTVYVGDPNVGSAPLDVGKDRGFLWRPGNFHLGPGLDEIEDSYDSILHKVNNTGRIATTYWQEYQATGTPGDLEDDYRAVRGVLVPVNDTADADGLPDAWEIANFGTPAAKDGTGNADGDALSDFQEYVFDTDPKLADTDADGVNDDVEIRAGMDPRVLDANEDIDGDGFSWIEEFAANTDPYHWDTDRDGQSDGDDPIPHTDVFNTDYDGDGVSDGDEMAAGSDPLDYFNGVAPQITIVSGDNQLGYIGTILPQPLVVRITDSAGQALDNAPVTFEVGPDGGELLTPLESDYYREHSVLELRTNAAGEAVVFEEQEIEVMFKLPLTLGTQTHIKVTAGIADPAYINQQTGDDFYENITPVLVKVDGEGQSGIASHILGEGFVVRVENTEGVPLVNAPVTLSVTEGDGKLINPLPGDDSEDLDLLSGHTDANGIIHPDSDDTGEIAFRLSSSPTIANEVTVTAGSASTTFTPLTVDPSADGDFDGDGLTDAEEAVLGTNPNRVDTDGDGLTDAEEVALFTNPNKKDSDDDEIDDAEELARNLDPNKADSDEDGVMDKDEPIGQVAKLYIQQVILETEPSNVIGGAADDSNAHLGDSTWEPGQAGIYTDPWTDSIPADDDSLGDALRSLHSAPYPEGPLGAPEAWRIKKIDDELESSSAVVKMSDGDPMAADPQAEFSGSANKMKVMLKTSDGQNAVRELRRSFVKVTHHPEPVPGSPEAEDFAPVTYEVVTLTIEEGEKDSGASVGPEQTQTLEFSFTEDSSNGDVETGSVILLPVEVKVPKTDEEGNIVQDEYVVTDELKVGKMDGAITAFNDEWKLNIDDDVDHFIVRIPGGASLGSVTLKVGTADNPSGDYDDDPTEIELVADGDDLVTPTMLLVSDEGDDDYEENGVGEDDKKNDRTHLVQLGGKLHLTGIAIGDQQYTIDHKVAVPAKYELDFKVIYLGGADSYKQALQEYWEIVSERYAQIGVQVSMSDDTGTLPDSVDPNNVEHEDAGRRLIGTDPSWLVNQEIKTIVDHVRAEQASGEKELSPITVLVVPNMEGPERGRAYTRRGTATADQAYADFVFLSAKDIVEGKFGFTPAHEIGHVLTNDFHYGNGTNVGDYGDPEWDSDIKANLMRSGTSSLEGITNHLNASKRLYRLQEEMLVEEFLTELP